MNNANRYLRISHDPRGTSVSTDRQRAEIERHAAHKEFTVVEWFDDPDISAFTGARRPGWDAMTSRIGELAGGGAIYVYELSRTSRQLAVSAGFFDLLERHDVALISVTQGDSREMDRSMLEMLAVFDAAESRKISRRVSLAHRYTAETLGKQISPKRSYGFRYDVLTKELTVVEEEAAAVRAMVARYIAGDGYSQIARGLNDGSLMGAPVRPLRGEQWWDASVRQLLSSPSIAGWVVYKRRPVGEEPTEPAIIDAGTWELLQAKREARKAGRRRAGRNPRSLLTGLARCGGCGGPMASNNAKSSPVYSCIRSSHGHVCEERAAMSEPRLDEVVLDEFWDQLDHDRLEATRIARREAADEDPDAELRRERIRLEAALEKLMGTFAEAGPVSAEIFRRKVTEYEDRIGILDEKLAASTRGRVMRRALPDVEHLWEHLSVAEKREVLDAFFEKVVVRRRPRGADPKAYVQVIRR